MNSDSEAHALICCSCGYDPTLHFPQHVVIFDWPPLLANEPICVTCKAYYLPVWWSKAERYGCTRPNLKVVC